MLISPIVSQYVPLLPAALFNIFFDHLGEFGKDLNSAIHSGGDLPSILPLSENTKSIGAQHSLLRESKGFSLVGTGSEISGKRASRAPTQSDIKINFALQRPGIKSPNIAGK